MKNALVAGKYALPVLRGEGARVDGAARGYYEYINKRTRETGRNVLCIERLIKDLPQGLSVYEPFGGVGAFSTLVYYSKKPSSHVIGEIDKDCLQNLRHAFEGKPGVSVEELNARGSLGQRGADLYLCDFPFHTLVRYREWAQEWLQMVSHSPKAIVWMDGASNRLHLHTGPYSNHSGREVTRDPLSYAIAMSHVLHGDTGYRISAATHTHGCFYFLATKGDVTEDIPLHREKRDGQDGFRWVYNAASSLPEGLSGLAGRQR